MKTIIRDYIWKYLRNVGMWLNCGLMCLIGLHPWMTLSAFAHLRGIHWLETLIDRLYITLGSAPGHCKTAAKGWTQAKLRQRNLW